MESFTIAQLNTGGIVSKKTRLLQFLTAHKVKILLLSESKCSEHKVASLSLEPFKIIGSSTRDHHPLLNDLEGGGTLILAHKNTQTLSLDSSILLKDHV